MDRESPAIKDIFLADDNTNDCLAFEKALLSIHPKFRLTTVTNGEELLQLLSHYVPELLFLDLEMPLRNGIQCLQTIRSNRLLHHLPIIVFTATQRLNNIQVAYGMGANLFFIKPRNFESLVSSLRTILYLDWNDPEAITQKHFANNQYQPFRLNLV
ncbi:MAG: response regulator [Flavisolibacter sp.]|jgi:CheY-like chemotaxis protein